MNPEDDAWKQYYDIIEESTEEWQPRADLKVTAVGHERSVRLSLGECDSTKPPHSMGRWNWRSTQRNVSTMRELAGAILAACDRVDELNPVWASHPGHRRPVDPVEETEVVAEGWWYPPSERSSGRFLSYQPASTASFEVQVVRKKADLDSHEST